VTVGVFCQTRTCFSPQPVNHFKNSKPRMTFSWSTAPSNGVAASKVPFSPHLVIRDPTPYCSSSTKGFDVTCRLLFSCKPSLPESLGGTSDQRTSLHTPLRGRPDREFTQLNSLPRSEPEDRTLRGIPVPTMSNSHALCVVFFFN